MRIPLIVLFTALLVIAHASGDTLYVTSSDNVIRYFPNGTNLVPAPVFATGAPTLRGMAADSMGNIYVANFTEKRIERYTPTGAQSIFASTGSSGPMELAFDSAGNLYASVNSQTAFNNTIMKFDPSGNGSVFASGLADPIGLAFDRSDNLYVANYGANNIQKFTPGGVGSLFAASSPLNHPRGLTFDANGNLYVANFIAQNILKYTPSGAASVETFTQGPLSLDFDSAGNLYVANGNDGGNIEKIPTTGSPTFFSTGGLTPRDVLIVAPEPNLLALLMFGALASRRCRR